MSRPAAPSRFRAPLLAVVVAALGACGGTSEEPAVGDAALPLLVDDEGLPMPSTAAAGARVGARQASDAQAAWLEAALDGGVVHVAVGCCSESASVRAVDQAWAEHQARRLGDGAPFFVHAADSAAAALVTDRLAEGGARRVWHVVTR